MTKLFARTAVLSAVLLLGTAGISAYSAGVTIGGGNGNIATATDSANGNGVGVNIGSGSGPLATVDSNGNPVAGGSQTNGTVNLGSLLAGVDLGGAGAGSTGDAGNGDGGQAILASLSAGDRQLVKIRCRDVLGDPTIYKSHVVELCRLVARM